jgi:hypothetical protein
VLPILLSRLTDQWIATDQAALLPLIGKNVAGQDQKTIGQHVRVEELDWIETASVYARRQQQAHAAPRRTDPTSLGDSIDLILAVDCLYNEALVIPFLHTIAYHAGHSTAVLAVSELRSSDVMLSFVSEWLALEQGSWEIWRVGALGPVFDGGRNVIWVGRRRVVK